jgi:hypothetical protein
VFGANDMLAVGAMVFARSAALARIGKIRSKEFLSDTKREITERLGPGGAPFVEWRSIFVLHFAGKLLRFQCDELRCFVLKMLI